MTNIATVNHSSNARQTDAHIFCLLRHTDTKQRYWNSFCFGDHDVTKVFGIITSLHCETSILKFTEFFFRLCTHSTHCVLRTVCLLHSTGCKIIASYCRLACTNIWVSCRSGHNCLCNLSVVWSY